MRCPKVSEDFIFADNVRLAAQLSCVLAKPGIYLPVCDGPRLQRADGAYEIIRRHNAAIRAKTRTIYLAGLEDKAFDLMVASLSRRKSISCLKISSNDELAAIPRAERKRKSEPLRWGRDRIGLGLLMALRAGSEIYFEDALSPDTHVPSKSGHLVVCEEGEELSQIIAANYAFALNAGLHLIPAVDDDLSKSLLETFYSMNNAGSSLTPAQARDYLRDQFRQLCGPLPVPEAGSITFIGKLPFGFAFTEFPSTHLFEYPDLGMTVVNGFAAEQDDTPGTGVAVLVDPGTTPAPEIKAAVDILRQRRAFIRVYEGKGASVRRVSEMIEYFPYDLLVIATHCGDSSGYRWTYEFKDSEGLQRTFVVDIAIGLASTDKPDIIAVSQFMRFVSLDGVDWNDTKAKANLYVGQAVIDFMRLTHADENELKPTKKETVDRVVGSSVVMMADGNYIVFPRAIASGGTPVIINNACLSWHRLAGTFMFASARAYIGTLVPVTATEASEVITKVLDRHWSKSLPVALWSAQREVYGVTDGRRPYVVAGVYPQKLRVSAQNYPEIIRKKLARGLREWERALEALKSEEAKRKDRTADIVNVYRRELQHFTALTEAD